MALNQSSYSRVLHIQTYETSEISGLNSVDTLYLSPNGNLLTILGNGQIGEEDSCDTLRMYDMSGTFVGLRDATSSTSHMYFNGCNTSCNILVITQFKYGGAE